MLRQQASLALKLIFQGQGKQRETIRDRIDSAENYNWEETVVGFYSAIKLIPPLCEVPEVRMFSYAFDHPSFPYGGVYNCTIVSESELELEGVTLGGTNWPYPVDIKEFTEMR